MDRTRPLPCRLIPWMGKFGLVVLLCVVAFEFSAHQSRTEAAQLDGRYFASLVSVGDADTEVEPNSNQISPFERQLLNHLIYRDRRKQVELRRAKAEIEAGHLSNGLSILQRLLDSREDGFVWLDANSHPSSVRNQAFQIISSLSPSARKIYEQLFGIEAKNLLDHARQSGNPALFHEISRRFFHTQAGFEAVNWQATRWMDRGWYELAERSWERLLAEPAHRQRITSSLIVKSALACQSSGRNERATMLLNQLKRRELRIGGRMVRLETWWAEAADAIGKTEQSFGWPMVLGNPRRTASTSGSAPFLQPRWTKPLARNTQELSIVRDWENKRVADPLLSAAVANFPVVVGDRLFLRDFYGIRALSLKTGESIWNYQSKLSLPELISRFAVRRNPVSALTQAYIGNSTLGMLAADDQRIYAVEFDDQIGEIPKPPAGRGLEKIRLTNRLIAIPITSETKVESQQPVWWMGGTTKATDAQQSLNDHYFLGVPLPVDGILFAMTEANRQVNLVALKAATGELLWSQGLALVEQPIGNPSQRFRYAATCTPSFAEGVVVCPTGLGLVVGVDALTGTLLWVHAYGEQQYRPPWNALHRQYGHPGFSNVPQIQGRRVVLLPRHSKNIRCIDLFTGRNLWPNVPRQDAEFIAAVTEETVLVVGNRYTRGLSLISGQEQWSSLRLGMPSGRGVRINGHYLLPLKAGRVATIDIDSGREIGFSISAGPFQASSSNNRAQPSSSHLRPGNLVAYGDVVVSIGPQHVTAFPQAASLRRQIQSQLPKDPQVTEQALLLPELELILGESDSAQSRLVGLLAKPLNPPQRVRTEFLLRELLYRKLDITLESGQGNPRPILSQLDQLAHSSIDRGRFLIRIAEWQLDRGDFEGVLRSTAEFAASNLSTLLPMPKDPTHLVSAASWVPGIIGRTQTQIGNAELARIHSQIDEAQLAAQQANSIESLRNFLAVYSRWPQANSVRTQLAKNLIETGHFQEAELLLLENRKKDDPRTSAAATELLVKLWDQLGLHREAAPLLAELNGRFRDVRLDANRTGRRAVTEFSRDSLTWAEYQKLASPDWSISHVTIAENRSPVMRIAAVDFFSSGSRVREAYGRYRQKFLTANDSTFTLLDKGSNKGSLIAIIDKQTGVITGNVKVPARHSRVSATWVRNSHVGHFMPMGSPATMHGISLIEHKNQEPVWNQTLDELKAGREIFRVGPAGPRFCLFQTKQHLVAIDPATGRMLWRRTDLEPNSGLLVNQYAGLFGDDEVIVMFAADRSTYTVYRTMSGEELRHGKLDIDLRYRPEVFGRKLFFATLSPVARRMRIWDPLTNQFEMDEPIPGRYYSSVTPNNELAIVLPAGRLRILNVETGQVRVDLQIEPDQIAGLNYIRVFSDHQRYYINFQRPLPMARGKRYNYYASDTFLPRTDIHGELIAINRSTGRIEWKRVLPQRTCLHLFQYKLPFLVLMSRVKDLDRRNGDHQALLVEILDTTTGDTIGRKENIFSDRIVQHSYDRKKGQLQLHGLNINIDLNFGRNRQQFNQGETTYWSSAK